MRNFFTLDQVVVNEEVGVLTVSASQDSEHNPMLSLRREGSYIAISVSYGPLEVALRPRFSDVARVLGRLHPVGALQTTRQVGTGQAYLALGLREDQTLVVRPTIVADATGHFCFNLLITHEARKKLFDWLPVEVESEPSN
ncbi:MAG: hypothetical protein MUF87_04430 [Anaerolineae bacterium]|jgi:hypothetical protein|nr:hypothetical protein [Anaerolineae bacterium]